MDEFNWKERLYGLVVLSKVREELFVDFYKLRSELIGPVVDDIWGEDSPHCWDSRFWGELIFVNYGVIPWTQHVNRSYK